MRIAHIISHAVPYYVPVYREVSRRSDVSLEVFYLSDEGLRPFYDSSFQHEIRWSEPLAQGYTFHLSEAAIGRPVPNGFDRSLDAEIIRRLWTQDFDAIWLHGRQSLTAWAALVVAKLRGIPVFLRDDQTLLAPRAGWKRIVKRLLLPAFYSCVKGLPVGTQNADYFRFYGTKELYRMPHTVDDARLNRLFVDLQPQRERIRREFGIEDDAPVVLFCGKLIEAKRPDLALSCFETVCAKAPCHFLIAGDGPMRKVIQRTAANAPHGVHFAGFLDSADLARAYIAADLLVLPSERESWGMVVNEAMLFGLPVIVSDRVGAGYDLVRNGWNGYVFPFGDSERFATLVLALVSNRELRESFGKRCKEMVAQNTAANAALNLIAAVRACSPRRIPAPNAASSAPSAQI